MSVRPIIAALGDSLTVGEHADGAPLHNHPWPALTDVALFPYAGVAQFGLGGDTIVPSGGGPGMNTRFAAYIQGFGFAGKILWGGVNDIIGDVAGATVAANAQTLLAAMLADGPTLFIYTPGFGTYVGWSAGRQTQLMAFRASMQAWALTQPVWTKTQSGLLTLDLYQPYPAGINDPADTKSLWPPGRFSDGLHINPDPGATHVRDLVVAKLAPLFPAPTPTTIQLQVIGIRGLTQLVFRTFPQAEPTLVYANRPDQAPELVHDGASFQPGYQNPINLRTPIPGGWEFTVIADAGWAGATVSVENEQP